MRYAISFTGILMGSLKGVLNIDEIEAAKVGCGLDYCTGDLGIPQEVTWGGGKEQKSFHGRELPKREDIASQKNWDNWVKVRDMFNRLREQGKLERTEHGYTREARNLIEEGHTVWMNHYGWLDTTEELL